MDRAPTGDDLIFPARTGNNLRDPVVHANLLRDLKLLGLRPRRVHDARRTFISLALADGARKDILRWVTHGPEGDIVSLYTTLPWAALCEEVAKLRVEVRACRVLEFHRVASVPCDSPCDSPDGDPEKLNSNGNLTPQNRVPRAGFEPAHLSAPPPQDGVSTSFTTWAFRCCDVYFVGAGDGAG
jgi:hypothetical protein